MLAEIVASVFSFILIMIISIAVMIYGWGLEPKNWTWIIGGGIVMRMIISLMEQMAKTKK